MKVTALEEYGLRCMVLLARKNASDGPAPLTEIAQQEGVSVAYAGKLLAILKKAGLVSAVRGRHGGYALTRPSSEITLKEIFAALGEPVYSAAHCSKFTGIDCTCVHIAGCSVRNVWRGFDRFIGRLLDKITLAEILESSYDMSETYNLSLAEDRAGR
jgi:Rrf2 family protein